MGASILSRVIAIAVLTVPVGYLIEVDQHDWRVVQKYSHSELLVFLVLCGVTACIESLAWICRRVARHEGDAAA